MSDPPLSNQNALGGSIHQDVFQDATTLDTLCRYRDGWREWPLSASDGDLAMLAQMTSEGLVSHIHCHCETGRIVDRTWYLIR